MKTICALLLVFTILLPVRAGVHVEAEDCVITSWNLSPAGGIVQIVVPPTQTGISAVEIVGGVFGATGVGQLRFPGTIPNGDYLVTLRYFTNRAYIGSEVSVQFGSYSGAVVPYDTLTNWHTFYPDNGNAAWYSWYDVELTNAGCPFPTSPSEPLPTVVGIYNVNPGDFYINIWDKSSGALDLASIDYIELALAPARTSDMNNDGSVDELDLFILSQNFLLNSWLAHPNAWIADIAPGNYGDGIVNSRDFSSFSNDWLKTSLHVSDISALASETGCAAGSWSASFVVSVKDKNNVPVSGVAVNADWTGVHGSEGSTTETTDINGQALFSGKCIPVAGITTLTVSGLDKEGHVYAANENVETSEAISHTVAWSPVVRAEDWLIASVHGNYSKVAAPGGQVVRVCTDDSGNPTHALGELKFSFPGAMADGNYKLTVHWFSGTMGNYSAFANAYVGTPWAYLLGDEASTLTENGAVITTEGNWHYFYPGHDVAVGAHSNQWFTHDFSGPAPVDFSMWPNSPVSTSFTVSAIGQGDFYIKVRDISPAENNYFDIEYFELTPIP
jgi:hypothetical protein